MSLRVLLTDADPVLLSIYRAFLVDQRIEVHTAANALDCLEELWQCRPDVLVLDADLPCGSGLAVLVLMSEDITIPAVPVLLLGSGSAIADKDVAIRDDADDDQAGDGSGGHHSHHCRFRLGREASTAHFC